MKKILLVLTIGITLGVLFSTTSLYTFNYKNTDGFILANGEMVGGDFITFYTAGILANQNRNNLYDYKIQHELQKKVFKSKIDKKWALPFIYPPLVAYIFSYFTKFSFLKAYFAWSFLSLTLFFISLSLLYKTLDFSFSKSAIFTLFSLAFIPFSMNCIGAGQTSNLGFLIYTLCYILLKKNKNIQAGISLGFAYYKPPIFFFAYILLFLRKNYKIIFGIFISGTLLTLGTILFIGLDGFFNYIRQASGYTYGNELLKGTQLTTTKGVGLFAILKYSMGENIALIRAIYLAFTIILITLTHLAIKKTKNLNLSFALIITISLFLSPQMVIYDLTMLILPITLTINYILNQKQKTSYHYILIIIVSGLFLSFAITNYFTLLFPNTESIFFTLWSITLLTFILKRSNFVSR